jgi:hypothetical protein
VKNKKVRERNLKEFVSSNRINLVSKNIEQESLAEYPNPASYLSDEQANKDPSDQSGKDSTWEVTTDTTQQAGREQTNQTSTEQTQQTSKKSIQLYSCYKCGKKYSKKSYADVHCKPKPSWNCAKCGKEISQACNVKRHERSCSKPDLPEKEPVNLNCCECGREFKKLSNLVRHMRIVHNKSEEKELKCLANDCVFTTDSEKQMKKHKTMRHGETSLAVQCRKCEFSCFSLSGLRHHMVTIHGTDCPVCKKLFSSNDRMKAHLKVVHKDTQSSTVNNHHVVVSRKIGEHAHVVIPNNNNGEGIEDEHNENSEK